MTCPARARPGEPFNVTFTYPHNRSTKIHTLTAFTARLMETNTIGAVVLLDEEAIEIPRRIE